MLFFDFETTNLSYGSALIPENRIVMVSWAEGGGTVMHHYGDIMRAGAFWDAIQRNKNLCAFNEKFEILWLKRLGFDVDEKQWHDPMLAEKVLQGNRQTTFNLGDVCGRYGFDTKDKMIDSMMKSGVCPSDMPQKRLIARCNRDVRTMRSLWRVQVAKLRERDQIHLYRNRCDFGVVLAHIEAEGMVLDANRVQAEYTTTALELALLQTQIDKITGGINMNSPDQKAHFLYGTLKFPLKKNNAGKPLLNKPSKQFPGGRPKTDKDTLIWLATKATTAKQKEFIALSVKRSKTSAALSKNLEFFKGVVDERGSVFHAQFNQTVAATHRLTSSGMPLLFKQYPKPKSVQFQNMPRAYKRLFCAPDGYLAVEVDAMQLEFRVAAFLGQDEQALKDIADPNFDAHIFSASEIYDRQYTNLLSEFRGECGTELQKAAKALRQASKSHTFKPLYGGTYGTEGEMRYYRKFAERYKGLAAVQESWLADVMASGSLRTAWGMKFEWDVYVNSRGVAINKRTYKPVGPQVYNYPVQNLATAEIVPIAIVALYRRCKDEGIDVKFVNTVHDSVICYVRMDSVNVVRFREAAEWAFTDAVYEHLSLFYNVDFDVPLGMEMVAGNYWNEGIETVYDDVINRRKAA